MISTGGSDPYLPIMKALVLAALLVLIPFALQAQGSYTICEMTEFCICNDGDAAVHMYTFHPCQAGWITFLTFCGGDFPQNLTTAMFDGPNGVFPAMGQLGPGAEWQGVSYIASIFNGSLTLRLAYMDASELSCSNGDYGPLVVRVSAGPPGTPPSPPAPAVDCTDFGSSCFPTSVGQLVSSTAPLVGYAHGALQIGTAEYHGEVEVRDLSGRLVERHRMNGEGQRPIRASLTSGMYVVVLRGIAVSASQLIAVP